MRKVVGKQTWLGLIDCGAIKLDAKSLRLDRTSDDLGRRGQNGMRCSVFTTIMPLPVGPETRYPRVDFWRIQVMGILKQRLR